MRTVLLAAPVVVPAMLLVLVEAAQQRRRRRIAAYMERARTLPAELLGREPVVRIAEVIVFTAWVKSGRRCP
jgi:hypothetical protein